MREFSDNGYDVCAPETVDALRHAGLEVWTHELSAARAGGASLAHRIVRKKSWNKGDVRVFCQTEDGHVFRLEWEMATGVGGDGYTWTFLSDGITMTTEDLIGGAS